MSKHSWEVIGVNVNPFYSYIIDEQGEFHNYFGPAITYNDGNESYYIHGFRYETKELWKIACEHECIRILK